MLPYQIAETVLFQLFANSCCPAALPDNGVIDWAAVLFFPYNGRFPLVCNADRRNFFRTDSAHQ